MKYWQRKKQERLYKQWTQHSELPPEAVPTLGAPDTGDTPAAVRTSGVEYTSDDTTLGRDARHIVEGKGWWYLLRLRIHEMIGKLLRV